jgi:hypothetical protein
MNAGPLEPASQLADYNVILVAVAVAMIVVMTLFAAAIVTVDPMAMFAVTRNPDHFPIALPIAITMGVIRTIADVDLDLGRANSSAKREAGAHHAD